MKDDVGQLDGALRIPDADTIRMIYHLLDQDGLYFGASTALNVVAAKQLAQKLGKGSRVVTILCDGAYRSVSPPPPSPFPFVCWRRTGLWTDVGVAAGRYQSRLFSKKWLVEKGLYDELPQHLRKYVALE